MREGGREGREGGREGGRNMFIGNMSCVYTTQQSPLLIDLPQTYVRCTWLK